MMQTKRVALDDLDDPIDADADAPIEEPLEEPIEEPVDIPDDNDTEDTDGDEDFDDDDGDLEEENGDELKKTAPMVTNTTVTTPTTATVTVTPTVTPTLTVPVATPAVEKVRNALVTLQTRAIRNQSVLTGQASAFLYRFNKRVYIVSRAQSVLVSTVNDPFEQITVGIADKTYNADLLAVDATSDVALLQVAKDRLSKHLDARKLTTMEFADSSLEKSGNECFIPDGTRGVIREPEFASPKSMQEQVVTDMKSQTQTQGQPGQPLLNARGLVIGFVGGCSSRVMVPILNDMIRGVRLTKLPVVHRLNKVKAVYTYRKATFGDVSWQQLTQPLAVEQFPSNYLNLPMAGIVITSMFGRNVLEKPVKGRSIQTGDIITAITNRKGNWVAIGSFEGQVSPGVVLWQYDPNRAPIVSVRVIHDPKRNSKERTVKLRFDINYPQSETTRNYVST
jgi:hypothetical protein